jgi:Family of unknown function (DUF5636)
MLLQNKLEYAETEYVQRFLLRTFHSEDGSLAERMEADMAGYAQLAIFLSKSFAFAKAAAELSGLFRELYRCVQQEGGLVVDTFAEVLRVIGRYYGFHWEEFYILNDQVDDKDFREVISNKVLFHDAFTRPHGEYTHAVQWLVMAYRFRRTTVNVTNLYANSVKYRSREPFDYPDKTKKRIYIWNFLVDCFRGSEDFESNIMCDTFRCPQIVTTELVSLPPHAALGAYIAATSRLGLKNGVPSLEPRHNKQGRRAKPNIAYTNKEIEEMLEAGLVERTGMLGILRIVTPGSSVWIH